jgi:hypothetical protein
MINGEREQARQLRPDGECRGQSGQLQVVATGPKDEVDRSGDEGGDDEVVLRGHRLQCDLAQRCREERGKDGGRPAEAEPATRAVHTHQHCQLGEELRERGERVAAEERHGVEDPQLGVAWKCVGASCGSVEVTDVPLLQPGDDTGQVVCQRVEVVRRRCHDEEHLVADGGKDDRAERSQLRVGAGDPEAREGQLRQWSSARIPEGDGGHEQQAGADHVTGSTDQVEERKQLGEANDTGPPDQVRPDQERRAAQSQRGGARRTPSHRARSSRS